MKKLAQQIKIKASLLRVWQALTVNKEIDSWGGGPAQMTEKEETRFKLWGGDIHGTNTRVIKEKELDQDWFSGNWPKPSKVVFRLSTVSENLTLLQLDHSNIPDDDFADIKEGWDLYYLKPMKEYLEQR